MASFGDRRRSGIKDENDSDSLKDWEYTSPKCVTYYVDYFGLKTLKKNFSFSLTYLKELR